MDGKSCRCFYSELELTTRNFSLPQQFPLNCCRATPCRSKYAELLRKFGLFALFSAVVKSPNFRFFAKGAFEIDEFAEFYANLASHRQEVVNHHGKSWHKMETTTTTMLTMEMIKLRINFRFSLSSLSSNVSHGGSSN
jgi:hypothetical protein